MAFRIIKTTFDPKHDRMIATVEFLPCIWLLRRKRMTRVYMGSRSDFKRMFDGRKPGIELQYALVHEYLRCSINH